MNREKIEKTLFILPTCLFLLAISIFPFIYSVYLSAFQAKLTKMHRKFFIGWENYQILLFEDDVFLGPSMVFTNVINPRAAIERKDE